MNALEVRVIEVKPAVVNFNYQEMSAYAKQLAEEYKGLTFDEETVKEGKKTVAELKKIQKSVNDFKVKTKKELTESVALFESQCKDIISEFDEPINFISNQLDVFETERVNNKTFRIKSLISLGYEQAEIEPKFQNVAFKEDWLNITKKEKEIEEEIRYQLKECANAQDKYYSNCATIQKLVKIANLENQLNVGLDEQTFIKMLDYKTIEQIEELINQSADRQKKSEQEYKTKVETQAQVNAAEIIEKVTEQIEKIIPVDRPEGEPVYERTIKIKGTKTQLVALKNYLEQVGIEVL